MYPPSTKSVSYFLFIHPVGFTLLILPLLSVEDDGEGIMFNVFVYNVQPGIKIDYKTGDSELNQDDNTTSQTSQNSKNTETN